MLKKYVYFRAMPESPNSPPSPQFGELGLLFLDVKSKVLRVWLNIFLMMIMMVAMIIMMVILMIIMTKITKKNNNYCEVWVKKCHFRDYYLVKKGANKSRHRYYLLGSPPPVIWAMHGSKHFFFSWCLPLLFLSDWQFFSFPCWLSDRHFRALAFGRTLRLATLKTKGQKRQKILILWCQESFTLLPCFLKNCQRCRALHDL